jgi:hypothetical protein
MLLAWSVSPAWGEVVGRVESIGFEGLFRQGAWTPMRVVVTDDQIETGAYQVRITQRDLDGDVVDYLTPVTITSGAGDQTFWAYFQPEPVFGGLPESGAELATRLKVTLVDADGADVGLLSVAGSFAASVDPPAEAFSIARGRRLVLMLGGALRNTTSEFDPARLVNVIEDVVIVSIRADRIPEDPIGLDGVDAIIAADFDPTTLRAGASRRLESIESWVEQGGHLVLVTTPQWPVQAGWRELMPVTVQGLEEASDIQPLLQLARQGDTHPAATSLARAMPRDGSHVVGASEGQPWLVRRGRGFGTTTWVGYDLSDRRLSDGLRGGWTSVWSAVLGFAPMHDSSSWPMLDPTTAIKQRHAPTGVRELGSVVDRALELAALTATFVLIALIFFVAYWAVVGPGLFFALRYFRRSKWNWAVFALAGFAATGLTMGVTWLVLRGPAQVSHFTVVRLDEVTGASPAVLSRVGLYIPRDGLQTLSLDAEQGRIAPLATHPRFVDNGSLTTLPQRYAIDALPQRPVIEVPFRRTQKKLAYRWRGRLDWRIDGRLSSSGNAAGVSGILTNLTDLDLVNVYLFYPRRTEGGVIDSVLYMPRWDVRQSVDLEAMFSATGVDAQRLVMLDPSTGLVPDRPQRGSLRNWSDSVWFRNLPTDFTGDLVDDLNTNSPTSIPLLSVMSRLGPMQRLTDSDPRFELRRSAAHDIDAGVALTSGNALLVAEARNASIPESARLRLDDRPLPMTGRIVLQVVLPFQP